LCQAAADGDEENDNAAAKQRRRFWRRPRHFRYSSEFRIQKPYPKNVGGFVICNLAGSFLIKLVVSFVLGPGPFCKLSLNYLLSSICILLLRIRIIDGFAGEFSQKREIVFFLCTGETGFFW